MQCQYKKQDGSNCNREAISDRGLCLLHEDWDHKNEEEIKKEFYREIEKGITDFEGCILPEVELSGRELEGDLSFKRAIIKGDALFHFAIIKGHAQFEGAAIEGALVWFKGATIKGDVLFDRATIEGTAWFFGTAIKGSASFNRATIEDTICFGGAVIEKDVSFQGTTIKGSALFQETTIKGSVSFLFANVSMLTFKDARFNNMKGQENACREARTTQERIGNRELADYHFYREMEAKRKQKYLTVSLKPILRLMHKLGLEQLVYAYVAFFKKPMSFLGLLAEKLKWLPFWDASARRLVKLIRRYERFFKKERRVYWGFLELPVQYIFGYGVYPFRVIGTWLLVVFIFALIYWFGNAVETANSLGEYIYFSVVTAATPGYGGYHPRPGIYQTLATFQAIFGTFMWAAFIATFARKFMR